MFLHIENDTLEVRPEILCGLLQQELSNNWHTKQQGRSFLESQLSSWNKNWRRHHPVCATVMQTNVIRKAVMFHKVVQTAAGIPSARKALFYTLTAACETKRLNSNDEMQSDILVSYTR